MGALGLLAGGASAGAEEVRAGNQRDAFARMASDKFTSLGTEEGDQLAEAVLQDPVAFTEYADQWGGVGKLWTVLNEKKQRGIFAGKLTDAARGGWTPDERAEIVAEGLRIGIPHQVIQSATKDTFENVIRNLSPNVYTAESVAEAHRVYEETGDAQAALRMVKARPLRPYKPDKPPIGAQYWEQADKREKQILDSGGTKEDVRKDRRWQSYVKLAESGGKKEGGSGDLTTSQQTHNHKIDDARRRVERAMDRAKGRSFEEALGEPKPGLHYNLYPEAKDKVLAKYWGMALDRKHYESDEEYRARTARMHRWMEGKTEEVAPSVSALPAAAPAEPAQGEAQNEAEREAAAAAYVKELLN